MKVLTLEFNGISNIGLYGYLTKEYLLLGKEVSEKYDEQIEKALKVKVKRITIAGTSLIGVFLNGDKEKIVVPDIIFEHEEQILKDLKIDYEKIETVNTCLGNNIVVGEDYFIVNNDFKEKEIKQLEKSLGKKGVVKEYANVTAIGSLFVLNKNRGLVSNELNEKELKEVEKILGKELTPGSMNMGSPYVKAGLLVNENGMIAGRDSGGPEISNAEQALKE